MSEMSVVDENVQAWARVAAHLRRTWTVRQLAATWLEIEWSDEIGERVTLEVGLAEALDEAWIEIRADVCAAAWVSPSDALEHNASGFGALGFDDGRCVLRHALALRGLTPGQLDRVIETVAGDAASLRAQARPPAMRAAVLFDNWIE